MQNWRKKLQQTTLFVAFWSPRRRRVCRHEAAQEESEVSFGSGFRGHMSDRG